MRINQKVVSIFIMLFGIVTCCLAVLALLNYVDIIIVSIFLGVSQLLSGFNQISLSKQINSKGKREGNKAVGQFSIIVGIGIVILSIKMIL